MHRVDFFRSFLLTQSDFPEKLLLVSYLVGEELIAFILGAEKINRTGLSVSSVYTCT